MYHVHSSHFVSVQLFCWWSWCTLWWELPGSSSITSRALMSLPKTWLWVSERNKNKKDIQRDTGLGCFTKIFAFVFFVAGIVACNWLVILSVCITLMCTFDPTGRTFVKLKATRRRQRNLTTYTLRYVKSNFSFNILYILNIYI